MEYIITRYGRYLSQFIYVTGEGYSFKWTDNIKLARRFQNKTIAKILASNAKGKASNDPFKT
jgi:hypothetical protein